jgi:hypothetical protein
MDAYQPLPSAPILTAVLTGYSATSVQHGYLGAEHGEGDGRAAAAEGDLPTDSPYESAQVATFQRL